MNKNIKLVAIASALVGGYLLYDYLKSKPIISSETPASSSTTTNNVASNSGSYQTYGNTSTINNPAYQTYVSAVQSGAVQNTYQNYMASVPEGSTSPSQYLLNYVASTQTSTNISNLPNWIQAEIKAGGTYTDTQTGITYV
jgi:hypothetical protein